MRKSIYLLTKHSSGRFTIRVRFSPTKMFPIIVLLTCVGGMAEAALYLPLAIATNKEYIFSR